MATINLATDYKGYVDEQFTAESKTSLLTNRDFDWIGAHSVRIYKVTTSPMNDYGRNGATSKNWSRYGAVSDLDATTEEMALSRDRSFTFVIDSLDMDETKLALEAATALARQQREVVIPEIDMYVYQKICSGAGTKPEAVDLTASNIYDEVLKASQTLDDAMVPEVGRVLLVTPAVYAMMKKNDEIVLQSDVGNDLRLRGVIGLLDGAMVIKVPTIRLPEKFGFLLIHPMATVAPIKLEDYKIHDNPPGINGNLVEGRICYDAFVLKNKAKAIYYQAIV